MSPRLSPARKVAGSLPSKPKQFQQRTRRVSPKERRITSGDGVLRTHAEARRARNAQRCRHVGKFAQQPPRLPRIDDFLYPEWLRRPEGRAQPVKPLFDFLHLRLWIG